MGKRSNFERKPRDNYPTPYEAVIPLLPHLHEVTFIEPCAGEGQLVDHLEKSGKVCVGAHDIRTDGWDARTAHFGYSAQAIVTNPPWEREALHAIILNCINYSPTWLLIDADWMHTKQAAPYIKKCSKVVSVGRVKWIKDSPYTGKDNCCWYLFTNTLGDCVFVGR